MSDTNTKSFSRKQIAFISVSGALLFTIALGLLIAPAPRAEETIPQADPQDLLELHADALRYDIETKKLEINVTEELVDVDQANWQLLEHTKRVVDFQ